MTRTLFVFFIVLCFFTACNDDSTASKEDSPMQKNLAASHIVNKAFETGDASQIDSAVASDFVDHTDRGDVGRDSLKAFISSMKKDFPDMKMEVIKELADSEYVFSLMRFTGTSNGTMGMPKGPYDMKTLEVVRYKDGKAAEHWAYMDAAAMAKMMGQAPDSTRK
ncbi:MAG TPA: ester cyclase [Flavitalea sp.]|nr:ester cyclase [Flavitalea sp.]